MWVWCVHSAHWVWKMNEMSVHMPLMGHFFVWIIHSYLIRDTNKKMLKTLYFVWSSGSPLFYLFNLILSERACHGSDEWDSTRSAYRVSLRKHKKHADVHDFAFWPCPKNPIITKIWAEMCSKKSRVAPLCINPRRWCSIVPPNKSCPFQDLYKIL